MGEGRCLGADPIILVDHAARRHSGVEGAFSAYGPKLKSEGKPEAGNNKFFKISGSRPLTSKRFELCYNPRKPILIASVLSLSDILKAKPNVEVGCNHRAILNFSKRSRMLILAF